MKEVGYTEDSDIYDFTLYDEMPRSTIVHDPFRLYHGINEPMTLSSQGRLSSCSGDLESGTSPSEDTLVRCKRIAHLLFVKYIGYNAVHEINISGALRNKYVDLDQQQYEHLSLVQFVTLYDKVISEMMKYQSQSYRRWSLHKGIDMQPL